MMHIWEQVGGVNTYEKIPYVPYFFVPDKDGTMESIYEEPVRKVFSDNYQSHNKKQENIYNDGTKVYENKMKPEIQFLVDRYYQIPDIDFVPPKLQVVSIDIEVLFDGGFSQDFVDKALGKITIISLHVMNENKTYVFGLHPYKGKYCNDEHIVYYNCGTEEKLLKAFYMFLKKIKPDVITGWNCIPVTNTIYKENEIIQLSDIKKDDILYKNNGIKTIYPKSYKKINEIILANGHILKTSKDHIIPVRIIDNNKYTKLSNNYKNINDLIDKDIKVKDIPFKNKSCFVKIPFDLNKNDDINVDNELLYLIGLIYTDGSLKDKKNLSDGYRVYQSNEELLENIPYITTKIQGNREKGFCRGVKYTLIKDLHNYIYDENGNKSFNINLLSKLSKKQFYYFLSGLLDGDGGKSEANFMYCDYTKDGIDKLYELCLWNGIFTTKRKNGLRFIDYEIEKLHLKHPYRWNGLKIGCYDRKSSQKASLIRFKKISNNYYVKINDIIEKDEIVEMCDIKTSTGYFITSGVKVHNCELFDMYYIINRSKIMLGEKSYLNLSPVKNVYVRHNKIDGKVDTVSIAGIELLDYMELYKWYSPNNLERYTLGFVSTYELEKGKIDYSEYKDLNDLYRNNWDLYVTYNIIDAYRVAQLEHKLGYIKLVQTLSLLSKVPMKHYQSMTMLLEGLILTYCRRHNLCAPTFKGGQQETFEAAWVKEPQTGKYKWLSDLDITSSYPSHIITLNMSTETYYGRIYGMTEEEVIDCVKNKSFPEDFLISKNGKMIRIKGENLIKFHKMIENKRISIAPCGTIFTTGKTGLIASLEKELFIRRKETKKIMIGVKKEGNNPEKAQQLDRLQNAYKSMLNSMFGICSVPYSRYYLLDMAEAIVSCGRNTIKSGQKYTNNLLNAPNDKLIDIINRMKNE